MDKFIKELNKVGRESIDNDEDVKERVLTHVIHLKEYLEKKLEELNKFYADDKLNWQSGNPTGTEFLVIRGNTCVEFLDFDNLIKKEKEK